MQNIKNRMIKQAAAVIAKLYGFTERLVLPLKKLQKRLIPIFILTGIVYLAAHYYVYNPNAPLQKSMYTGIDAIYKNTGAERIYALPHFLDKTTALLLKIFGLAIISPLILRLFLITEFWQILLLITLALVVEKWVTPGYPRQLWYAPLFWAPAAYLLLNKQKFERAINKNFPMISGTVLLALFAVIVYAYNYKLYALSLSMAAVALYFLITNSKNSSSLFIFTLIFLVLTRLPVLENARVWDYSFHLIFTREILETYPHIPGYIDSLRGGAEFTYPPLAHYLLASVYLATGQTIPLFALGKIVVVFAEVFSGILLFALAKEITGNSKIGLYSLFLYAFIFAPIDVVSHFSTVIGAPFMLATLFLSFVFLNKNNWTFLILAGVFFGLTLMTSQIGTITTALILFVLFGYKRKIKTALTIVFVGLAITAGWWLNILERYPLTAIYSASQNRLYLDVVGGFVFEVMLRPEDIIRNVIGSIGLIATPLGILKIAREKQNQVLIYILVALALLAASTYLGFYIFVESYRYLIALLLFLCIVSSIGLYDISRKKKVVVCATMLFLMPFIIADTTAKSGEMNRLANLREPIDTNTLDSFFWLRENAKGWTVASDMGHANWMVYEGDVKVLNGRKLNEFAPNDSLKDRLVAQIFKGDGNNSLALMADAGVKYLYYGSGIRRQFPVTAAEDYYGKQPSILIWKTLPVETYQRFDETPNFKRVYEKKSENKTIIIYEALY